MRKNQNADIQIGQLNLRIPGYGAETAYRVGNGIGDRLAQKPPPSVPRRVGALNVRVRVPPGASEAEVSDVIAEAIMRSLRK